MKHDVFISYRRDGGFEMAYYLYEHLTRDGYSVTFDIDALRNGRFDEALLARVDECTDFVVILNPGCFNRSVDPSFPPENDWLRRELAYALERGKNVIPILLGGFTSFPVNLPDDIRDVQFMHGPVYVQQYIDTFYEALKTQFLLSKPLSAKELKDSHHRDRSVIASVMFVLMSMLVVAIALSGRRGGKGDGPSSSSTPVDRPSMPIGPMFGYLPTVPQGPVFGESWSVDLPDDMQMTLVQCNEGMFHMGSPEGEPGRYTNETLHFVRITHPFWIGETEVTQGQWHALMQTTLDAQAQLAYEDKTSIEIGGEKGTNRDFNYVEDTGELARLCGDPDDETAMYNVSWDDATNFCARLTQRERAAGRLPDGYVYRLPTEAEWEYAARAGTKASLPDGSDLDIEGCRNAPNLDTQAWYAGNSSVGFLGTGLDTSDWPEKQYPGGLAHVRRVRQKAPNAWGLYDVLGNVFEWCLDWYSFGDYPIGLVVDPIGPESGTHRVVRGGSWICNPVRCCRLANRRGSWPNRRTIDYGFRVVLAPAIR